MHQTNLCLHLGKPQPAESNTTKRIRPRNRLSQLYPQLPAPQSLQQLLYLELGEHNHESDRQTPTRDRQTQRHVTDLAQERAILADQQNSGGQ